MSIYVIAANWPAEGAPLGLPWWAHLLCLAVVALEIGFRVAKLYYSAKAVDVPVSVGACARTILGGDFAASITPSRSGSEPARFLVLTEAGTPVSGIILVLFIELFLEMLSLLVIAALMALLLHESGTMMRGLLVTVIFYAGAILGAGFLAYRLSERNANGPPPRWVSALGVHAGVWRRVQRTLRQVRGSVSALRRARKRTLSLALLLSILHVAARLLPLPIIVASYGGVERVGPLVLWPLLLLYGAAVAPAPGGGGVVEFAFKAALGGTLPAQLLGASLIWWRVYTFYIYIVVGAVAAGRTVMRALRRDEDGD
ncbi:MAG: lysylphosphatidylglycerol synthase transmembrane domain-containing protein [Gemmatimonadaceae bacterium]